MKDRRISSDAPPVSPLSSNLALLASKRVAVLAQEGIVPLLPSNPVFDSTRSPWNGLYLEEHNLPGVPVPEHEHSTFLLHLQMNDRVEMDWHSSGRTGHQITGAGNLIFLTPGTRDSLLFYGPSRRVILSIDPLLVKRSSDQLELKEMPDFENSWSFQDEQLRLLITEMKREMSSGWALGSLYGDSLSTALVVSLIKKRGKSAPPFLLSKGGISSARLRLVLAYMDENLHRNVRLSELAGIAGLSAYHFARSFRQTTGVTPHRYLTQKRMDRAKSLLVRPKWTILQIAGAVGFADASRFSKVFRASTGETPASWRRHA